MIKCPKCSHEFNQRTLSVELPDGFNEFYSSYPRKVGRGQAIKAYRIALKSTNKDVLLRAARGFSGLCSNRGTSKELIPHPSTWLSGLRWLDEDLPASSGGDIAQTKTGDEQNEQREHEHHPSWGIYAEKLRKRIGDSTFKAYFSHSELRREDNQPAKVVVFSNFERSWIERKVAREVYAVLGEFEVVVEHRNG